MTHSMQSCGCNWNEKVNSRGEGEAAAEENRTAERKKGILRKIHHRGPQDTTEVEPEQDGHTGLETQGIHVSKIHHRGSQDKTEV